MPGAGGLYQFLREAYGSLPAFLYGWAAFLVINCGGIAALALGFGEYLGTFLPFFSTSNSLVEVPVGRLTWALTGAQVAAALAIAVLTVLNVFGVREGATVQNALTIVKLGGIAALVVIGLTTPAATSSPITARLPAGDLAAGFGVAMIAALWTYDGWYGLTFLAGEMRRPARSLPIGLVAGTLTVVAAYVLLNLVYVRALSVEAMGETTRIAETAAAALWGRDAGRLVSLAVLISILGCLSATILYCPRLYLAMARDGLFFRSVAAVHPRHHTPHVSLWAQGAWSLLLAVSGTYAQLYTYVVFALVLFHTALGAAVFVLRRTRPGLPRPYRTWGYPVVPILFIAASLALVMNTLAERPVESLIGLAFVILGLPAYGYWRAKSRPADGPAGGESGVAAPPAASERESL